MSDEHSAPTTSTPHQKPRTWGLKAALLLALIAVIALTMGMHIAVDRRDDLIRSLAAAANQNRTEVARLESENAHLAQQMEILLQEIGTLNIRLDETYAPREVGGMVDFPIERGMARRGDTLDAFAKREGTTIETLRALNDWLPQNDATLKLADRQMLWIPKKSH